jgi:hypothetical protein
MNDLLIIACGAGLHDGLNPCIFMTCAVFIVYRTWVVSSSLRVGWFCFIFALAYVLSVLVFNFGPGQILIDQKNFIFSAKIIYVVFSIVAFIAGVLLFKDWVLLRRGLPAADAIERMTKSLTAKGFTVYFVTVVLVLVLSSLASLCPINNYITILGGMAIIKGQWQIAVPILSSYIAASTWPLWFVWAFLSVKNLRPSLLKIICAAVFFTASSCVILILK